MTTRILAWFGIGTLTGFTAYISASRFCPRSRYAEPGKYDLTALTRTERRYRAIDRTLDLYDWSEPLAEEGVFVGGTEAPRLVA